MAEQIKKERNSNLELYRIITMLLIVAHHYVVNSGLYETMMNSELTANSIFLYIFGMWGKTGINCFVLITGYFMCKSSATVGKFFKLVFEVLFYQIVIYAIFLATGVVDFSIRGLCLALCPIGDVGSGFVTGFILFYPFIPFLNKLIQNITKKQHLLLVLLCLFIYTIWEFMPVFNVTFNYVTWFIILYFISSYIRLYPSKYDSRTSLWAGLTVMFVVLACLSVFVLRSTGQPYRMVSDSNAILAIVIAICSFMWFKNIKLPHSKIINMMGASAFGVLLIHANSDAMRQWLWRDTLNNVGHFSDPYLWIHAVLSVITIFIVCVAIDQLRIKFIEKPFLGSKIVKRFENFVEQKIN